MDSDVERDIARLRSHLGVVTEAELARALMIGQSTISTWKARGRVPARVLRILQGENPFALATPPVSWSANQKLALGLALVRYCRLNGPAVISNDFRSILEVAHRATDLWALFRQAQADLRIEDQGEMGVLNEVSGILHDETLNPEAALARSREVVTRERSTVVWSDGREEQI